jgi:acetylornithine/succinyldiaminopimelate/putrescine aminotransferase
MHASTFGGNPIAAVAGIAMIETIEEDGLLERAQQLGQRFAQHLQSLQEKCPHVRELRQAGLMIGVELDFDGAAVVQRCLDRGLLTNCTQGNVLRLLPAMNMSVEQVDQGIEIFCDAVLEVAASLTAEATNT